MKNCIKCKFYNKKSEYLLKCDELKEHIESDSKYHGFEIINPERFYCPSFKIIKEVKQ